MITLSKEQKLAAEQVVSWYMKGASKPLKLAGYAGTGKTTLIQELKNQLPKMPIAFLAPTGKATVNMKDKLGRLRFGDMTRTIHSFLYMPILDDDGKIVDWEIKPSIDKSNPPGLLIVDESSMVTKKLDDDLLTIGLPILYVGDHGQLPPPTKDDFNLMLRPHIRLEEVHRTALDSPIIKLSMLARRKRVIPCQQFSDIVMRIPEVKPIKDRLLCNDQDRLILTDTNWKRVKLNRRMLATLGMNTNTPTVGTRVIFKKNNWKANIPVFNGMMGTITDIWNDPPDNYFMTVDVDGEEESFEGTVSKYGFHAMKFEKPEHLKWRDIENVADFGYCCTVHSAQGSEAKKVFIFGNGTCFGKDQHRWMYTAITRAKEELYICNDNIV